MSAIFAYIDTHTSYSSAKVLRASEMRRKRKMVCYSTPFRLVEREKVIRHSGNKERKTERQAICGEGNGSNRISLVLLKLM